LAGYQNLVGFIGCLLLNGVLPGVLLAQAQDAAFEQWVGLYGDRIPKAVSDCTADRIEPMQKASEMVEQWAAYLARFEGAAEGEQVLTHVDRLIAAKQRVDELLEDTLAMRTQFVNGSGGESRYDKEAIRVWLKTM